MSTPHSCKYNDGRQMTPLDDELLLEAHKLKQQFSAVNTDCTAGQNAPKTQFAPNTPKLALT